MAQVPEDLDSCGRSGILDWKRIRTNRSHRRSRQFGILDWKRIETRAAKADWQESGVTRGSSVGTAVRRRGACLGDERRRNGILDGKGIATPLRRSPSAPYRQHWGLLDWKRIETGCRERCTTPSGKSQRHPRLVEDCNAATTSQTLPLTFQSQRDPR